MTGRPMGTREKMCRSGRHEMTDANSRWYTQVKKGVEYRSRDCRECYEEKRGKWVEENREKLRSYNTDWRRRQRAAQ